MTWDDAVEAFAKYDIDIKKYRNGKLKFKDIKLTKQYFKRRPEYPVFEYNEATYNGTLTKNNFYIDYNTRTKGDFLYYQPADFGDLSDWEMDDFLKSKGNPTRYFRTWHGKKIAINGKEQLEWALKDFFNRLETMNKLTTNEDLMQIKKDFQEQTEKLAKINENITNLKKKYKHIFKTQAGINADF